MSQNWDEMVFDLWRDRMIFVACSKCHLPASYFTSKDDEGRPTEGSMCERCGETFFERWK